ncbi:MAG: NAD-dependent epimerase/dehydratase family protein [bacterium]|nr:NAD-dependent epimerase/dehydratase family protein [bacterium]
MKQVLVTGATGHVGYNIVQLLIAKGYRVRAGVRDVAKAGYLTALGAEAVAADILDPASLQSAVQGVDGVFQVAAVYKVTARDPQKEIIEPSIEGGLNVLRAAKAAGVRRVVFTSSVAAIGMDAGGEDRALTEEDWNTKAKNPYNYAKTAAEQAAWDFAKANDLDMVAINPSAIIGPGFFRHTPSTILFEMLLRGRLPVIMPFTLTFVDARDVAAAHVLAYEKQEASGRYICADYNTSLADLMPLCREVDPTLKVPGRMLPNFLLPTAPLFDWLGHKFTGAPRAVTSETIREMANNPIRYNSDRLRLQLGWQPRPIHDSLRDTLDWVRSNFLK